MRFDSIACKEVENLEEVKKRILKENRISEKLKIQAFYGWEPLEIRYWCKRNGIDEHILLELNSTEVAIITPNGILMEVRAADNNKLGLWGGTLKDGENPKDGAIREVKEETGISLEPAQLLVRAGMNEIHTHIHTYANGDKVRFTAYRFVVHLEYVPELKLSCESTGAYYLRPILSHQREFVEELLYRP